MLERCESRVASRDDLLESFLNETFLFLDKGVSLGSDDKDEFDVFDEIKLSEISRGSSWYSCSNTYFDIFYYD